MRYLEKLAVSAMPTTFAIVLGGLLSFARGTSGTSSRLAYSGIFSIVLALIVVGYAIRATRVGGAGGGIAAVSFAAWVPPMVLGAVVALDGPHGRNGGIPSDPEIGLALFVVAVIPWSFVVPLFGTQRLGRVAVHVAPVVLGAGALFVVLALVRGASRPDPDTWLDAMPTVRSLEVGDSADVNGVRLAYGPRAIGRNPIPMSTAMPGMPEHDEMVRALERDRRETCEIVSAGKSMLTTMCGRVDVAHDARSGVWVLRARDGSSNVGAFEWGSTASVLIRTQVIAKGAAPPIGWTYGAGVGVIVAVIAWLASKKRRNEAKAFRGVDGTHLGAGKVRLADGEVVFVPAAAVLPETNVRVALDPKVESYRETPTATGTLLGTGTLEETRAVLEARAGSAALASIVTVFVTAAPLAVAARYGLLWP